MAMQAFQWTESRPPKLSKTNSLTQSQLIMDFHPIYIKFSVQHLD